MPTFDVFDELGRRVGSGNGARPRDAVLDFARGTMRTGLGWRGVATCGGLRFAVSWKRKGGGKAHSPCVAPLGKAAGGSGDG